MAGLLDIETLLIAGVLFGRRAVGLDALDRRVFF